MCITISSQKKMNPTLLDLIYWVLDIFRELIFPKLYKRLESANQRP
jgi:hypothetical protein